VGSISCDRTSRTGVRGSGQWNVLRMEIAHSLAVEEKPSPIFVIACLPSFACTPTRTTRYPVRDTRVLAPSSRCGGHLRPDGGTGHPDHRIVSNIVTQLQRAGAPGVPERVFYMNLPVESMRAMTQRAEMTLTVPQAKYFTVRVRSASTVHEVWCLHEV
jgi:hypothetical protein